MLFCLLLFFPVKQSSRNCSMHSGKLEKINIKESLSRIRSGQFFIGTILYYLHFIKLPVRK